MNPALLVALVLGLHLPVVGAESEFFLHYAGPGGESLDIRPGRIWLVEPARGGARQGELGANGRAWLGQWAERHQVAAFAREYPSTKLASTTPVFTLAVQQGAPAHWISWQADSDCSNVVAAVGELREFAARVATNSIANLAPVRSRVVDESALAEILRPAKHLPFREVIHATTGHALLAFDPQLPAHAELARRLRVAAAAAGRRAARDGISAARANEAGNQLEPLVRDALRAAGLPARVPVTTAGAAQATGYPDIEIDSATPCYLELKTYNAATAQTTQRTFYYSPAAQPKVTRDALHLLFAFELEKVTRGGVAVFVPVRWRLLTLQDLVVDLKYEFNQSNRGLYGPGAAAAVLAEGAVE